MKRIHYGEYLIETDGEWARVFDKISHKRIFEGELNRVLEELSEKLEGELAKFDFSLDFGRKGRKRGLW